MNNVDPNEILKGDFSDDNESEFNGLGDSLGKGQHRGTYTRPIYQSHKDKQKDDLMSSNKIGFSRMSTLNMGIDFIGQDKDLFGSK